MRLFQTLMFLGGRRMTAGHNDDIDEPFPQNYGNRTASERAFKRLRDRKRKRCPADIAAAAIRRAMLSREERQPRRPSPAGLAAFQHAR